MTCDRCYRPSDQGEHGVGLCPLEPRSYGLAVRPDDIPGGLTIEHGLCHEDGTPRTYYSRSEIDLECQKRGLVKWTDVYSEDKTKDARVRMDWLRSAEAQREKRDRDEQRREGVYRAGWQRVAPKQSAPAVREAIRAAVARRLAGR